jgi:flagellar biosynthesis protein FlhG
MARQGYRTALVDADPGGGNAAVLCRLEQRHSVADVLAGRRTFHEALQAGPGGIQVLLGDWASASLAECSPQAQERFVATLRNLHRHFDYVILDAGSGRNRVVRRFWQAADLVLLVTSHELPSIMEAYASIKVLAAHDGSMPICSLVAMTTDPETADEVHDRLNQACLRFLGLQLTRAGHLQKDKIVSDASKTGGLFVLDAPASEPARRLREVAQAIHAVAHREAPHCQTALRA